MNMPVHIHDTLCTFPDEQQSVSYTLLLHNLYGHYLSK